MKYLAFLALIMLFLAGCGAPAQESPDREVTTAIRQAEDRLRTMARQLDAFESLDFPAQDKAYLVSLQRDIAQLLDDDAPRDVQWGARCNSDISRGRRLGGV